LRGQEQRVRVANGSGPMRHRHLHAALASFAEEAAWQLASVIADGVEVPFEVVEARGRRRDTPLYCYQPLTQRFVTERVGILTRLPAYPAAAQALSREDCVGDYLRAQGETRVPVEPRARADAALRVFVSRIFSDASEFVLTQERFDRAWRELEGVLHAGGAASLIVAPLLGVALASEEVALGDGLTLVQPEALEDPPADAVRLAGEDGALAVVAHTDRPGAPGALSTAASRLERMLRALRLFDATTPALAGVAWRRTGTGPWALAPLRSGGGRPRGVLFIPAAAEDELRAFCSLVDRRAPRSGEVAWALARHGMGCDRTVALEALSDHLLALRALLEPEGIASARLGGRLAALCAAPGEHGTVVAEVAQAVALERAAIGGLGGAPEGTDALAQRMAEYLRALLRDVLCRHLEPDLRALADRLIEAPAAQ
jgi:hypothetical protein